MITGSRSSIRCEIVIERNDRTGRNSYEKVVDLLKQKWVIERMETDEPKIWQHNGFNKKTTGEVLRKSTKHLKY